MEVSIIGAGPAGSTLAALLASRGVAVTLYDRESFPRDKLCGEFLSYDALPILERLGVLAKIDAHGAPRIERCRIAGSSRTYDFDLPHAARGVSRMLLDDLLLCEAIRRGARFVIGEAQPAAITVGAWGRWGRHDTLLARSFVRDRSHRNFGFKRHYRGPGTSGAIELYSFPRGYLGVNDVEGGITNICGLVHASRLAGHKGKWDAFVEKIREEEPALERLYARHEPAQENFLSSEPVIFRSRSAVEGGIFMIGDASGVIDPLTGNGMAMAIQSALVLAPLVMQLIESPRQRPRIEDDYRRRHRELFAKRIGWSRTVARLLARPRLLDGALATLRQTSLGPFFLRKTRASRDQIERLADAWFC